MRLNDNRFLKRVFAKLDKHSSQCKSIILSLSTFGRIVINRSLIPDYHLIIKSRLLLLFIKFCKVFNNLMIKFRIEINHGPVKKKEAAETSSLLKEFLCLLVEQVF